MLAMCSLQTFLTSSFVAWHPCPPRVVSRTKRSVTLDWSQVSFTFLRQDSLYRLERKEKLRGWVIEYCGSKTIKEIDNLGPCSPQKFRLRVILRTDAVSHLAQTALDQFGTEHAVYEHFRVRDEGTKGEKINEKVRTQDTVKANVEETNDNSSGVQIDDKKIDNSSSNKNNKVVSDLKYAEYSCKENLNRQDKENHKVDGDTEENNISSGEENKKVLAKPIEESKPWLESQWSEESWASTEPEGQSPASFCLAVRGGYTKQVQTMLEDRPALLDMINTSSGYTPLATAAMKGDVNMVKLLLCSGAEVNGLSANSRTALHVALLAGHAYIAAVLLDLGADIQAQDVIGLRAVHCAVDGGKLEALSEVLTRGGNLNVTDVNGWTPLFRAVVGEASTAMIEELIKAGSDVTVADHVGLTLLAAARVMRGRSGSRCLSALRSVDATFGHEAAAEHYTRLTRKIRTLHTAIM